jgi:Putative DNA-binding domain
MQATDLIGRHPNASPSYPAMLAPGLTDPEYETPAGIVGPNGKSAVKRYNVYRNNVTVSLIDALAAVFPATQRITGVKFFRAMARFYVRATPPRSPLLFEYGHEFPDFIERYEYARTMPYLADTARIERAWLDAYHAADELPLAAQSLALTPTESIADVVFVAHPATRIVRSQFPALSIFVANRGGGPVGRIETFIPEDTLVTRPDQQVTVRSLPPGGAEFLTQLLMGQPLGDAAARALETSPDFDLAGNIAGMIEAGVFASLQAGGRP